MGAESAAEEQNIAMGSSDIESIVIVGGGMAGDACAAKLRQLGYAGRITIIAEEPWRPYERPPLSKQALQEAAMIAESFSLKPGDWYDEAGIELVLGCAAVKLDTAARSVRLENGESVQYDRLLLATGGRVRKLRLAGADAGNVHYLRTKEDAMALACPLVPGARIAVVGMGVIGAEVAASARGFGCEVVAIEPEAGPMMRALGSRMSNWLAGLHRAHGVRVLYNTSVEGLVLTDGEVSEVVCSNGTHVPCDVVCVGIGIEPAVELARDAGLEVANGIVVNRQNRTAMPEVFAAGDVAEVPGYFGGRVRYETYQNSAEQGDVAALGMLGLECDNLSPCSFWSDQYECHIQVVGKISEDLDVICRGSMQDQDFILFYAKSGRVVGAVGVNRPKDIAIARRLILAQVDVDSKDLASEDISLRNLIRANA